MKIVKKLIISALVLVFATGVFAGCKGTERSVDERNVWVDGNKVYKDSYAGKEIIKIDFFDTGYGKDWIYEIAKDFVYENDQYALILNADSSLVSSMPTKLETGKNLSDLYFTPRLGKIYRAGRHTSPRRRVCGKARRRGGQDHRG